MRPGIIYLRNLPTQVLNIEVDDIIKECIRPNFVEHPTTLEDMPTTELRGKIDPPTTTTDAESFVSDSDLGKEEEETDEGRKERMEQKRNTRTQEKKARKERNRELVEGIEISEKVGRYKVFDMK